jgi:ATP-dependent DNA helicase RecQ
MSSSAATAAPEHDAIHEALQRFFGFDTFKGTQHAVIKSLLDGKDTFAINYRH